MEKNETEIIRAWIDAHKAEYESSIYEANSWAADYLIALAYSNPEELLNFIPKILLVDHSEKVKLHLGAGPLQDLVNYYSDEYFEKISNLAEGSSDFKDALKNVIVDEECGKKLANFINSLRPSSR